MRRRALDELYGHDPVLHAEVKREVEEWQALLDDDEEWVSVDAAHEETGLSTRKISKLAKDGEWKAYKVPGRFPSGRWRVVIPRKMRKRKRSTPDSDQLLDVPKETRGLSTGITKRWPIDERMSAVCLGWHTTNGSGKFHYQAVKQVIKAEALADRCDFYPVWYGHVDRRGAQLLRLLSDRLKRQAKQAGKLGVILEHPQLERRVMIAFQQSTSRIDKHQLLEVKARGHLLSESDLNSVRGVALALISSDEDSRDEVVSIVRYSDGRVGLVGSDGNAITP